MELRSLNAFVQVAELGSFSRAAEVLGYSQPTISVQIKQLEQELDTVLFERIGHTVRLTSKGRDVLSYAQQVCHLCQEMTEENESFQSSYHVIRLAVADSLCAPLIGRVFPLFHQSHPNIALKFLTAGTDELFRLLEHNEVDLVCTLDTHIYNANYVIANEEQVGVHFIVPSDSPLASKKILSIDDLFTRPFLLTEKGMSYRRLLDEWLARNSNEIFPFLEIGSADLICKLVEQGMGISFLPDFVTEDAVRRNTIARLDLEDFHPHIWKQMLYHRDKWLSPQMRTVIHHFSKRITS